MTRFGWTDEQVLEHDIDTLLGILEELRGDAEVAELARDDPWLAGKVRQYHGIMRQGYGIGG